MSKVKKPSSHLFLDNDGKTIVLRLAKGTSLSWRDSKKLRLLPTRSAAAPSRLRLEFVA